MGVVQMIKNILLLCVGVSASVAMSLSFQDAQADQQFYCEMVQENTWPDYRDIADKECKYE